MDILENIYLVFRIYPFGAPKLRAVKKEAKHYHFDWTVVPSLPQRFENLTACHLLKWVHYHEDTEARDLELRYFRDVDGREVDFVVLENGKPLCFVECKQSEKQTSLSLKYLKERFPKVHAWQISLEGERDVVDKHGIRHSPAEVFFKEWKL